VSKPKYQNKWLPNSLNILFWKEVLVGKKIEKIRFDDDGISCLILDSGEEIFIPGDDRRIFLTRDST